MGKFREQYFFGHGKILLTSEYFVLDGAEALALPTTRGQSLSVRYKKSFEPKIVWKGYDEEGKQWFETSFELWRFRCLGEENQKTKWLQKVFQQVRKQNPHFLRDEVEVLVETKLDFPREWGLGSSSSLLYDIAQWAYVSPFELNFSVFGGSGYDIACAQSMGPILYQKKKDGPSWSQVNFRPHFHRNLYFLHLGKKVQTSQALEYYSSLNLKNKAQTIEELSRISNDLINAVDTKDFCSLMTAHEEIIAQQLGLPRIQHEYFSDFNGVVKSLGAWGGDMALVASDLDEAEIKDYFRKKNLATLIRFEDLICWPQSSMFTPLTDLVKHENITL